jgi:hypothetical protein
MLYYGMAHTPRPAGTKYNRLEIIAFVCMAKGGAIYRFRCECGNEKEALLTLVKRGAIQSCGCLLREHIKSVHKTFKPQFDLEGQTFGRLTVVSRVPRRPDEYKTAQVKWLCKCECGNEAIVGSNNLRKGRTLSCGCFNRERSTEANTRHGNATRRSTTREYRIWASMLSRCRNPGTNNYKYYGGRGISVCERWHTFDNFLADIGEIPHPLTIDRIDNEGNYEPGNVRLATPKEQAQNKRPRNKK